MWFVALRDVTAKHDRHRSRPPPPSHAQTYPQKATPFGIVMFFLFHLPNTLKWCSWTDMVTRQLNITIFRGLTHPHWSHPKLRTCFTICMMILVSFPAYLMWFGWHDGVKAKHGHSSRFRVSHVFHAQKTWCGWHDDVATTTLRSTPSRRHIKAHVLVLLLRFTGFPFHCGTPWPDVRDVMVWQLNRLNMTIRPQLGNLSR